MQRKGAYASDPQKEHVAAKLIIISALFHLENTPHQTHHSEHTIARDKTLQTVKGTVKRKWVTLRER